MPVPTRSRWVPSRWGGWLAALTVLALTLRVAYVLGWKNPAAIQGDAFYYHHGANLLADGKGFPDPYTYQLRGVLTPDAQHPPLTIVLLSVASVVGLRGYLAHQLWMCCLGAAAVLTVGLVGRRVAGPRAGLLAAAVAATYPSLWLNDALVLSETPTILASALTLLAAYRFWSRRRLGDAALLGGAVALAALTRAELLLLTLVLVTPLVLLARPLGRRHRLALLAASGAACAAVLAPWVGYNLARFEEPELISSGLGSTLLVSNCPQTYAGPFKGWWWYPCITAAPVPPGDASRKDVAYRRVAGSFISAHRDELAGVVLARLGRVWGFHRPAQQLTLDTIETREIEVSRVGLGMFYPLAAGSVAGVVVLRRRRVPVLPLLAFPVVVSVAVAAFYGTTRFRAAAEPSLVLLAVVALDAALPRRRPLPPPGDLRPAERPASRSAPAVT